MRKITHNTLTLMRNIVQSKVKRFQLDFAIDVEYILTSNCNTPFVWAVRENGTHLVAYNANELDKVAWEMQHEVLDALTKFDDIRFYIVDEKNVVSAEVEQCHELLDQLQQIYAC